jgi:hypothetical protein
MNRLRLTKIDKDLHWKVNISNRIGTMNKTYEIAMSDYLRSFKRIDRDRCIQLKARIDFAYELIQTK